MRTSGASGTKAENSARYATFMVGAANDGARNAAGSNARARAVMFNVRPTSGAINDNS